MTRKPTHPGEVFLKDVLKPLGINITDAAEMQMKLTLWLAMQNEPMNVKVACLA